MVSNIVSEREFYEEPYRELLREPNDPSAGFLRLHITEYVEANGKLSPTLTEWLLQKVPIAPYCYLLDSVEGNEAVVYYRGGEALLAFNSEAERDAHDDIGRARSVIAATSGARILCRVSSGEWDRLSPTLEVSPGKLLRTFSQTVVSQRVGWNANGLSLEKGKFARQPGVPIRIGIEMQQRSVAKLGGETRLRRHQHR